ncbi:MAG: hypothetical protein M3N91_05940, partial [Pseudomonadota bacterium]|nr:hypothetical protein [Pseudomonadota bacterium]
RFDLELTRVPTARYPNLFVTHTRLQTSSDYKLLMYVDMRQGQSAALGGEAAEFGLGTLGAGGAVGSSIALGLTTTLALDKLLSPVFGCTE